MTVVMSTPSDRSDPSDSSDCESDPAFDYDYKRKHEHDPQRDGEHDGVRSLAMRSVRIAAGLLVVAGAWTEGALAEETGPAGLHGTVLHPDGRKAASATVELVPSPRGGTPSIGSRQSTTTDSDGAFAFEGIPVADYELLARTPDGACTLKVPAEALPDLQVLELQPASPPEDSEPPKTAEPLDTAPTAAKTPGNAVLAGLVLDEQGEAVAGAAVVVHGETGRLGAAWSDATGRYEVAELAAPQEVYVQARKGAAAAAFAGPFFLDEGRLDEVNLVFAAAASVEGRLRSADGNALRARVTAEPTGRNGVVVGIARAGSAGYFILKGLPPGSCDLYAEAEQPDGSPPRTKLGEAYLVAGETRQMDLTYRDAKLLSISGRVTDSQGKPLRATVYAQGRDGRVQVQTDDDGAYVFPSLKPGQYMIAAMAGNYSPADPMMVDAGSKGVDLRLLAYGSIEGQVVDGATGAPVTNFEACYVPGKYEPEMGVPGMVPIQDEAGKLLLRDVQPGPVTVLVRAPGYALAQEVIEGVPAEQTYSGLVVRLAPGAKLTGTVCDDAGQPVAGAMVRAGAAEAFTNAEGSFELDCLPETPQTVTAEHWAYLVWKGEVTPSRTETKPLEIVLSSGAALRGVVTLGDEPLADALVWAWCRTDNRSREVRTDPDGAYAITGFSAGEGRVEVHISLPQGGDRAVIRQVTFDPAQPVVADFRLRTFEASGTLEGDIRIDGNAPNWGVVNVSLPPPAKDESQETWSANVDAGHFRIAGLPAGKVSVEALCGLGGQRFNQRREAEIQRDGVTRLDFDFYQPVPVSGVVKGVPEGRSARIALLNGVVNIEVLNDKAMRRVYRDMVAQSAVGPDGEFRFEAVAPGVYTFLAWVPGEKPEDPARFATAKVVAAGTKGATVEVTLP
jgi:protocatechuate 3,4-dioxygenase beta subunit